METILTFDGGYGREGIVALTNTRCISCGKVCLCLASDGSEGEYDWAPLCLDCIKAIFQTTMSEEV